MTAIFEEILDLRSMTAIGYRIEDAIPGADDATRAALERMLNTNKLDEIYAIAHEQLGHHEQAATLRQWLADKAKRPQPELLLAD